MIGRGGILGVLALLVLSTVFAARNGARVVTVDIGLATLQRVPLPVVVFGAVLLGMLVMLVAGLHSDLKVRGILKARLTEEGRREREWSDRNQQDLFTGQDEVPSKEPVASESRLATKASVAGSEEVMAASEEGFTVPEESLTAPGQPPHPQE